jgi:hypothetical protein
MKLSCLAIGLVGCGAATLPVDPFVGDWKLNPTRSTAIDMMKVQSADAGKYLFDFGGAGETIAVDGTDQPGFADTTLAVTAEAPDHWHVVRKKAGVLMITAKWSLSQDGNTLNDDYTQLAPDGTVAVHGNYVYRRTSEGTGFAGTWERPIAAEEFPAYEIQIRTFEATGLSFIHPPKDVIRNFRFDGKDYAPVGHAAVEGSTSSARRVDERNLELTDKNHGTIQRTEQIEVSPDRKTLTQTTHPVGQHGPNVFVFERQRQGTS